MLCILQKTKQQKIWHMHCIWTECNWKWVQQTIAKLINSVKQWFCQSYLANMDQFGEEENKFEQKFFLKVSSKKLSNLKEMQFFFQTPARQFIIKKQKKNCGHRYSVFFFFFFFLFFEKYLNESVLFWKLYFLHTLQVFRIFQKRTLIFHLRFPCLASSALRKLACYFHPQARRKTWGAYDKRCASFLTPRVLTVLWNAWAVFLGVRGGSWESPSWQFVGLFRCFLRKIKGQKFLWK